MKKFIVKRLSERTVFRSKNRRLVLKEATDLVNGKRIRHIYRSSKNLGVVIIPILSDGRILLERQYRPAIMKRTYELPAGKCNDHETASMAAVRELEEETGFKARKMSFLYKRRPAPWLMDNTDKIFLAQDLLKTGKRPDGDEIIDIVPLKISKIKQMIKAGIIEDSGTREALLYWCYLKV